MNGWMCECVCVHVTACVKSNYNIWQWQFKSCSINMSLPF